jgi:hypothetical protein
VLADAADAGAPVSVNLGTVDGSDANIVANGAGARLVDQSAVDQGETYFVGNGGLLEITATPTSTSDFGYLDAPGTFVLANPAASNPFSLDNIVQGDVLELPGTSVSSVTFGAPIVGFTAAPDVSTGLEAISFIAVDVFQQTTASPSGEYLWSNAANWTQGVPTDGDAAIVGALGFDDLASLSLAALTLTSGGRVAVAGATLDVTAATAASGTPRNDLQRSVRKRLLPGKRLQRRRGQPKVNFLRRPQDDRHGFGVDRRNFSIWIRGQEAEQVVGRLAFLDLS